MKIRILEIIQKNTEEKRIDSLEIFTATSLSKRLNISRNLASQYLNELVKEKKLIKTNSRPVHFFHKEILESSNNIIINEDVLEICYTLDLLHGRVQVEEDFKKLIGYDGSLNYCVQQCKSAVAYPPNGLPILLYGPTGTGKSYMAQLMHEYAVNNKIIPSDAQFITLNCSEYANNPELLTANLFGHKQGAFTGAERDNIGLLKAAEGGFLFLDEVHCLSPESQEKLFLFMDKGIYHILGDNENWHKSSVRLIFATTENPEEILLKTLHRRIAIIAEIPSLNERPVEERKKLISFIFNEESLKIRKKIHISNAVYKSLMVYNFKGNIGQVKNHIRAGCANAFLQNPKDETLRINIYNMPALNFAESFSELFEAETGNNDALIDTEKLSTINENSSKVLSFYNDIIENFKDSFADGFDFDRFLNSHFLIQNKFYDLIVYTEKADTNSKFGYFTKTLEKVMEIITAQYKIKIKHNDIISFSRFIIEYRKDIETIHKWEKDNLDYISIFKDEIRFKLQKEYYIAKKINELMKNSLDVLLDDFSEVVFTLIIKSYNKELDINQTPAIIISHGYSTASSIADSANKIIGNYIFDAIDMPLGISTEQIISSIKKHLFQFKNLKRIVLLVDMGSLEDIYLGIQKDLDIDIGIINNVSTKLALDIGFKLINGENIEDILETSCKNNFSRYKYIKNRRREEIILAVCPTGLGTSQKIVELIEGSFPRKTDLKIKPVEYSQIATKELRDELLDKYDIKLVIGTINPNAENIPFVPLDGIITNQNIDTFYNIISNYLSDNEIDRFSENIVQRFSLTNILKYLTILNAEKVLKVVKSVVEQIENKLKLKLKPNIKIGLYIHLSCLVERLITKSEITSYSNLDDFINKEKRFIDIIKQSISEIESYFSVEIPVEEIGYIFDYIQSNEE